jgi:NAD(P)-dependent dehydrogenase (short-subunit alcohol dehydrogenase family)
MSHLRDLTGKTALVTGASRGIGKATAEGLARLNANLILVARDQARGETTLNEMRRLGGSGTLELRLADLSSQASVRGLAAEVKRAHGRLDLLINNAGGIFFDRSETVEGIERTLAVNHLAYFLLTLELLDLLKSGPAARVVNVASAAHLMGRLDLEDLQRARRYSGWSAYGQSKLCNILFTYELARRLDGTQFSANCLHPGTVASGFGRNNAGSMGAFFRLGAPFLIGPVRGARTTLHVAASPDVEGVSGKYFVRRKEARSSRASYDREAQLHLWQASERLVGLAA